MGQLNMLTRKTAILTVRERQEIRNRNRGNKDVEALLAEGDALRTILERGSKANKTLQRHLDEERKKHRRDNAKGKKAVVKARKK